MKEFERIHNLKFDSEHLEELLDWAYLLLTGQNKPKVMIERYHRYGYLEVVGYKESKEHRFFTIGFIKELNYGFKSNYCTNVLRDDLCDCANNGKLTRDYSFEEPVKQSIKEAIEEDDDNYGSGFSGGSADEEACEYEPEEKRSIFGFKKRLGGSSIFD